MRIIHRTVAGQSFRFYPDGAPAWYDNQDEHHDLLRVRPLVKPGDVVFDVGANHGLYTLTFSGFVGPEGMVLAFEPMPRNLAWLRANLRLNNVQNVLVVPCAVGLCDGVVHMIGELPGHKGAPIQSTHLDAFAAFRPSLIKIDVEGWELEVLRGAPQLLTQRPALMIDLHRQWLREDEIEELKGIIHTNHTGQWNDHHLVYT